MCFPSDLYVNTAVRQRKPAPALLSAEVSNSTRLFNVDNRAENNTIRIMPEVLFLTKEFVNWIICLPLGQMC